MRKVTKRLLTACVAALALGACQDSVTVVQPDPPPPPPPPPAIDATVSILGLRAIPGPGSVNPTNVAGDINVALNVEEGDNTVTQIDLLFNGTPLGCTQIGTNRVPGQSQGVSFSAAAGADEVECFWNTDDVVGACVGAQLPPAFPNGAHTLGARITLSDGTTRTASNAQSVTLNNSSFIMLAPIIPASQPVIGANGRPYVGGPTDLVSVAACPVSYSGTTVGSLGIGGYTTSGSGDADLGSGPGLVHQDAATPFVFNLNPAANGSGGAMVEDFPAGAGHNFGNDGSTGCAGGTAVCFGSVFNSAGLNVSSEFTYGSLLGVYADYVGPTIAAGAFIQIGGAANNFGHYSAGAFSLSAAVTDAGVGFASGSTTFNVNDVAGGVAVAGATAIADLTEDDNVVNADANGFDAYEVEVVLVADLLANASTPADLANIVPNPDGPFGVDKNAPVISNLLPATDPADSPVTVLNDVSFMFDQADPALASGDAGSGINFAGCNAAIDGVPCTFITATDESGNTYEVDDPAAIGATMTVDIADAGGGASAGPLADGLHTVTISTRDLATPANVATDNYTIILDTTAPVFGALNPAPVGSGGTSASAIVMTIGGSISDANIVTLAQLDVFDAGADATCATGDDVLLGVGSGPNQVDVNSIDLTNGTNSITFNQSFTIQQPSTAAVTSNYCFIITAEDEAVDKTGAANPNMNALPTIVQVVWNAG